MCGTSYPAAGVVITDHASMSVTLPAASSVNPCGEFIHEFTATTEYAPPSPQITIGTPVQKCAQPESRFQPKM